MPKALHEYTWRDWRRLRPLAHRVKEHRYRRIDRRYLSRQPPCPEPPCPEPFCLASSCSGVASTRDAIGGQKAVFSIAFNDPETIELQIRAIHRFLPSVVYVVVDNSSDPDAASRIGELCDKARIAYVRLAPNPWNGRNASRSHGLAMNAVWQHLVRPGAPTQFGFIDHDLFPTAMTDPFSQLGEDVCYGDQRWAGSKWFLWAGFCFFDTVKVNQLEDDLDFGLDWFAGLDTGGANWKTLYRHLPPAAMKQRRIREVAVWEDVDPKLAYFEWRDDWIHEVGLAGDRQYKEKKRCVLREILHRSGIPDRTGDAEPTARPFAPEHHAASSDDGCMTGFVRNL